MRKLLGTVLLVMPAMAVAEHDLAIEIVEVVGKKPTDVPELDLSSHAPLAHPVHDAGALLRAITGMDAARRGGRGFEPIIRGQSQNQINVISDGAYNFGGCPSRMDPPSTYVGFDNFDKVTVIKGNRTVIHGAGGSGGTLLFEHQRPEFSGRSIRGEIVAGHTTNSDIDSLSANIALGNDSAFIRVFGEEKSAENYEDAEGNTVSSAFDSSMAGIIVGGDITAADYLEVSHESANEEDIYYAGNGMDAPYADSTTSRLKWLHSGEFLIFDSFEAKLYRSDVEHLMDNYSVRNRNPMPNGMAAPTSSDTWGGRLMATVEATSYELKLGIDYLANDRDAKLFRDDGKDGSYEMLVSYMWPAVEQRRLGVFGEIDYNITKKDSLRLGARYDDFEAEAVNAEQAVGMMATATPTNLYDQYYNTNETVNASEDLGLVIGWDHRHAGKSFTVNLSHSVRHPDTTESFIARNTMMGAWVGNPNIEAEKHHQLDITLASQQGRAGWSATIFWNQVDDYIERYQDANATLYRNIRAYLRGVELEYQSPLAGNLFLRSGISYTRGTGDNGDLANIAPLNATLDLAYEGSNWTVGTELVAADRQTNFDPDVDVNEETPGFAVVNLYGNYSPTDAITLEAGVENLFDKLYAYHVNKASVDPFDPTAVRVYEPGTQYWVRARYHF